ncbi:MAG: hypothetical protein AB7E47_03105 [Desulfovibrionaceae bacterium]
MSIVTIHHRGRSYRILSNMLPQDAATVTQWPEHTQRHNAAITRRLPAFAAMVAAFACADLLLAPLRDRARHGGLQSTDKKDH